MKMKKLSALLALILALCLLAACGKTAAPAPAPTQAPATEAPKPTEAPATPAPTPEPTPEPAPEPTPEPKGVTVTDMTGREITLEKPAERVVALSAADCELLFAVGAGDKLVGRGEYCDYPAEVLAAPSVQSGYDTNIEQIIALTPDVLLMSTMAQTPEQIAQLEAAGIAVVVSDAQDIEGVYTALRMIGKLMDKNDEAEKVVAEMKSGLDAVAAKAAVARGSRGTPNEKIYFEVSPLEWGLWASGGGTFMNEVAELLALENIFADEPQWAQISEEQVIERDPDYILTITMYYGEGETPEEEIAHRSGWENIAAVKNGAILRMDNHELERPTPRIVEGAEALYKFVYES